MGCISGKVSKITDSSQATVTKSGLCKVEITAIDSVIKAFITYIRKMIAKVSCERPLVGAEVSYSRKLHAQVGLICTTTISEDIEMWWCDGWRVLWNNKLRTLWRGE